VPRKKKNAEADKPSEGSRAVVSDNSEPKKRGVAKRSSSKKAAAAPRKAKSPTRRTSPISAAEPSDEMIRTRAYFIAERRHRLGLPGDASSDWLEAKRQLLSELGPR
jgi:hypothetical protein